MILPFALLIAAQAVAPAPSAGAPAGADCSVHMLEIPVMVTSKGLPKESKVKICGKTGQSDAAWADTLRDALAKVEANPTMSPSVKDQIVAGLKLEIAKLPSTAAKTSPSMVGMSAEPAPSIAAATPAPVLPKTPDAGRVEYSALPPMPAPLPAATAVVAANAPPPLPAPKMSFHCLSTNTIGREGPCDALERDTVVTVKADEDLPNGTSLRFMRRGDNRAEIDLAPLRRGQSQRFALPAKVCQGVTGSRIEIQVIRATVKSPQVVDTRGPFELTC